MTTEKAAKLDAPDCQTKVVIHLNAKLSPEDQGELEDAFLAYSQSLTLPIAIIGGGSLVEANGESIQNVIELLLDSEHSEASTNDLIDHIIAFFEATLAPKGSYLVIYETRAAGVKADHASYLEDDISESARTPVDEGHRVYFGRQEGLALYLNGKDLPKKVYQKYHVRQVFDRCNTLLKGVGMVNSYWQGYSQTALYMYGDSYQEMVKRIEPVTRKHPLCDKSRLVQIA